MAKDGGGLAEVGATGEEGGMIMAAAGLAEAEEGEEV
jgi:hypothetical protein